MVIIEPGLEADLLRAIRGEQLSHVVSGRFRNGFQVHRPTIDAASLLTECGRRPSSLLRSPPGFSRAAIAGPSARSRYADLVRARRTPFPDGPRGGGRRADQMRIADPGLEPPFDLSAFWRVCGAS